MFFRVGRVILKTGVKPECPGRWEVKYLWDVQRGRGEGVFSMSSMQGVLIFSGMIQSII